MLSTVFGGKFKFQGQDSDLEYFLGRFGDLTNPSEVWLEGGPGGPEPPQTLADQLFPIRTRGANYAPHTTANPSGFKKLPTPLSSHFLKKVTFTTISSPEKR